ncbi:carboxymuconolactone decarboxylase family protein [Glutamicibacter sp. AOP12-B1-11]|uniref:carboxymuconolactone decarboxylase family protein n=1 Tax=Micrococcaceae TaxID=1268 RepID=UPI0015E4449D|nr:MULTISPECIES: carboxymuconolactone decarboxylase family protein [unclassified Arthrobacter]
MADSQTIQCPRANFEAAHGFWNADLENLLKLDPNYFESYDRLLQVAGSRGSLTPIQRELICISVNAQVTYLNSTATEHHIRQATHAGASTAEIAETIQLAASLGTHSMLVGMPIAHGVFEELGVAVEVSEVPADEHRRELKAKFIRNRKYWSESWDTVLAYSPEYFEAYLELSSIPWEQGPLDEFMKELIYIAIDVATTHLFVPGIRTHVKKAIEYGATPDQIVDVMTLASNIGIHTTLVGASTLAEEMGR